MLLMGLRLAEPLSLARLEAESGGAEVLNREGLARMQETGLISVTNDALQSTEAGRQRLEYVLSALCCNLYLCFTDIPRCDRNCADYMFIKPQNS